MSDNIYVTLFFDKICVNLNKLAKYYYVIEYKSLRFDSKENPYKTQKAVWNDPKVTLYAELLFVNATKLRRNWTDIFLCHSVA